jgi:hypothetical protein
MKEPLFPHTVLGWLQLTGGVIVAVSAGTGAYQYSVSRADYHVEQCVRFLERFDGDRLAASQRRVDELVAIADDAAERGLAGMPTESPGVAPTGKQRALLHDRLFVEAIMASKPGNGVDVPAPIQDITSFFNGLEVCVEQKLCDRRTAHAFLDGYAASFWQAYGPLVRYARDTNHPHFASGMERFVLATGSSS